MTSRLPLFFAALTAVPGLAQAAVPDVLTDIPPVQSLVAQVMGDLGQPGILLSQGSDPHDFQLRPSQARDLQNANLVFWIGPELEPWLERAIEGIEVKGETVELLESPGTYRRQFGENDPHDHAHDEHDAHEEAADAHEGEADAGHMHDGTDPHAWLDPANAEAWLDTIATQLGSADPENAATYRANADAAKARIEAMDAEISAELTPVAEKPFLVFHDAYGYFADHYGLTVAGALSLGDAATPGAAHLTELRKTATESGALCIFPEAQHDPKMVSQLVQDTPVKLGEALDPSGSSLEYGPELYETLMRSMAQKLTSCLSGS